MLATNGKRAAVADNVNTSKRASIFVAFVPWHVSGVLVAMEAPGPFQRAGARAGQYWAGRGVMACRQKLHTGHVHRVLSGGGGYFFF